MRRCICILFLLICFVSCSKGQSNDYSEDILGCWRIINIEYEPKSNYPEIDSIAIKISIESFEKTKNELGFTQFLEQGIMKTYEENGKQDGPNDYYELKGDSIFIQSSIRSDDQMTSKISISNDTLYFEANVPRAFKNTLRELRWDYGKTIPEDIKVEKMMRYTICVRVRDCDKYKK